MPKIEIDYSNTIIYKITCKNPAITDVYVGHTTNFVQRKHSHKQSCINNKATNYSCKLYEVIRANGGWVNWQMEIIDFFNCADHSAARQKEQEYFIILNATLNSNEPFKKPEIIQKKDIIKVKPNFDCNTCNIKCNNLHSFNKHNNSNKHQMYLKTGQNAKKIPNLAGKFICEKCEYRCRKESDYKKHLATRKHLFGINLEIAQIAKEPKCLRCSKQYKTNSGLWKHKKTCIEDHIIDVINEPTKEPITEPILEPASPLASGYIKDNMIELLINENKDFKNIILELVKSNSELQKQMFEVCKNSNTTINGAMV